jgi:hypothetical protein
MPYFPVFLDKFTEHEAHSRVASRRQGVKPFCPLLVVPLLAIPAQPVSDAVNEDRLPGRPIWRPGERPAREARAEPTSSSVASVLVMAASSPAV